MKSSKPTVERFAFYMPHNYYSTSPANVSNTRQLRRYNEETEECTILWEKYQIEKGTAFIALFAFSIVLTAAEVTLAKAVSWATSWRANADRNLLRKASLNAQLGTMGPWRQRQNQRVRGNKIGNWTSGLGDEEHFKKSSKIHSGVPTHQNNALLFAEPSQSENSSIYDTYSMTCHRVQCVWTGGVYYAKPQTP